MAYASASLAAGWSIDCSWSETSTSTTNNTSTISITGKIWRSSTYAFSYTGAGSLTVYWHDNRDNIDRAVASIAVNEVGYSVNERSVSGSITVTHHSDGNLSGYAFTHWEKSYNSGYIPPSGNAVTGWVALTTIPRAAPINSFTGNTVDGTFKVTYTPKSNSFTHKLRISIPNVEALQTKNYTSGTNFTLDASVIQRLYNYTANSKTVKLGAVIETWNGGTKIGESSELINTCTVTEAEPIFSNYTFADTNSTAIAITEDDQTLISGISTLEVTISAEDKAEPKKSATMVKYTYQVAGLNTEAAYSTSDIVKSIGTPTVAPDELPSGTRDLVVTAIDSRGNQTAITKQVTIVPYEAPKINASAERASGFENATTIKIAGTFSRIEVGGTAKNTVNASTGVKYRYKEQSTTTWGSWQNRTATIDAATGRITVADFQLNLDNQKAFDFEFQITDRLGTTTASVTVSIGQPAFWIGDDGRVSVGGMPTQSKNSDEAGLLQVMGRIFADNIYPVGSIYMTATMATATEVENKLGGTWEAWGAGRVPVGMGSNGTTDYTTVEATGGEDKHTLTVSEMPKHRHPWTGVNTGATQTSQMGNYPFRIQQDVHENWTGTEARIGIAGGGAAHENRQPYITVYMYKRTA